MSDFSFEQLEAIEKAFEEEAAATAADGVNLEQLKAQAKAIEAAAAAVEPCKFHELEPSDRWKKPAFFTCTTGVLLWGQLHTLLDGFASKDVDAKLDPQPPARTINGTILQQGFCYRAPARKGIWKVVDAGYGGNKLPLGFVCHHVDVDGADILRRAGMVGVSLTNNHPDREIVYVNRYDWARWGCPRGQGLLMQILHKEDADAEDKDKYVEDKGEDGKDEYIEDTDEKDEEDEEDEFAEDEEDEFAEDEDEYIDFLISNRFMMVDALGFPHLLRSLKQGVKLDRRNYLFQYPSNSSAFGVNLCIDATENELGWMAFQNDELVGFVYDGVYCDLECPHLRYGETAVEVPKRDPADVSDFGDGTFIDENPFIDDRTGL